MLDKSKIEKYAKMSEDALWKEFNETKDEKKKEEIKEFFVRQYAPLVKYIAGKIAATLPENVEFDELVSYGLMGLLDAIYKYDPDREPKTKFKTYAVARIHGQILDGLRESDWISRTLRQTEKELKECIAELQSKFGRAPTEQEIADALNITIDEYRKRVQEIGKSAVISLYDSWHMKESEDEMSLIDLIEASQSLSPDFMVEKQEVERIIREELEKLPEKELQVLILYYYEGLTLKEIGEVLNVTESRVSQIHTQAVQHLKIRLPKRLAGILGK